MSICIPVQSYDSCCEGSRDLHPYSASTRRQASIVTTVVPVCVSMSSRPSLGHGQGHMSYASLLEALCCDPLFRACAATLAAGMMSLHIQRLGLCECNFCRVCCRGRCGRARCFRYITPSKQSPVCPLLLVAICTQGADELTCFYGCAEAAADGDVDMADASQVAQPASNHVASNSQKRQDAPQQSRSKQRSTKARRT